MGDPETVGSFFLFQNKNIDRNDLAQNFKNFTWDPVGIFIVLKPLGCLATRACCSSTIHVLITESIFLSTCFLSN